MTIKGRIFAISTTLLIALLAFNFYGADTCSISEAKAREMVLKEILRNGFDPDFLRGPKRMNSKCAYDFLYENKGHKVSYVVADDWQHGPELHSWDYAADKNGP